ncbi:MAG: hypothetical protein R3Y63_07515 [Eubacteriales bacterium]
MRKCQEEEKISLKTAFFMRLKILFEIVNNFGIDDLDGISEMDETFFAESFKGNHNRQKKEWVAPRNSKNQEKEEKNLIPELGEVKLEKPIHRANTAIKMIL